ncbi:MAG: YeeE/YedE family protein [Nannocystaceae bacterium]
MSDGSFWPWWLGGLALASVAVGFLLLLRRQFGISSGYTRLVEAVTNREDARASAQFSQLAAEDLESLLMAATAEASGRTVEEMQAQDDASDPAMLVAAPPAPQPVPASAYVLMFVGIAIGASIAAVSHGTFELHTDMGTDYAALFGTGWISWMPLILGGMCVGAGTRMGGGCTTGHGLSGCSRLQAPSLVNTACFFGTGVAVSMLLDWVVG